MNAETIKSFLVSLGFEVDEAGAQRFNTVLKGVTLGAVKAGLAIEGAALSVVGFTTQIANGLDKVYWASQRTGASVQGIKALGYSVAQMGGNVQAATSSLEGLARFLRSSPGAEGFLNRLGVQTRDASGKMRDTADIFTGVGQKLNSMPVYRAKQYAQMLGIDEDTLLTIRRGLGQVSSEYALTAKRIGLNTEEAAKKSNTFISSLTRLTMTLGQARDKIGSSLAGGLASGIDDLRKQLLDNWPKIEAVLTKVLKGILWAASALTRVLWRTGQAISGVIDWFNKLDPATKQLIELFGGLLIAWRLLNTAFLTSPIGIILSLFTAIGLLWEDYQTWKEHGKSLIDWGKWKPEIDAAVKLAGDLQKTISDLTKALAKLLGIDPKSWSLKWDFENFLKQLREGQKMLSDIADLLNAVNEGRWSDAAKIGKRLLQQGDDKPDAMPAVTKSALETRGKIMGFWDQVKERWNAGGWYNHENAATEQHSPTVQGNNTSPDIPGNEPEQHAQSVKRPRATTRGKELLSSMASTFNKLESLYRLPEGLLKSVAITESGGNRFAQSGVGAKGLFQFMDGTAKDMGLRGNEVFDPEKSAQAAAKYLSQLLKLNGGDLRKALASYNWGIGNVQKHGLALMPQETRNYIPKVMSNMPGGREGQASNIQQQNTYNIYGGNAHEVGSEVEQRQLNANAKAMRTTQVRTG
ncbi:transglycosylase SLT domain-containing protein [Enterobacteriaceae bacterium H11S18]|uniref:lytic transglycosylase domain-containing protein n=1 Tax=Dryocola clanedunensis TaxID=2925396 RepID=UPI0022F128D2|nr:transglycosylase SLT domain-containing protein [Dryocola clanedunensis]MCT4713257.1 transglycosylase SLT domain-containing protein [Dryocola clanedunensis]